MDRPYFPMFVDLSGKRILVFGGGKIALRRIRTMLRFRADIRVVAPEYCEELVCLEQEGKIRTEHRGYRDGDIPGDNTERPCMILAATDSREVNRQIWKAAKKSGIPVNVSDDKNLCDFYFPSVVMTEDIVVGISSGGSSPAATKAARVKVQELFQNK